MTSTPIAKPLRFGIIGAGSIAEYHVNGLRAAGSADVVAIAASSKESAQQAARRLGIQGAVGDWRELLAAPDLDVVVVATPDDTHREIACAALAAGLHVLLQKPMALTLTDCQTIADAARTSRGMLGVSFMPRYFSEIVHVRRLLSDPTQPLGAEMAADELADLRTPIAEFCRFILQHAVHDAVHSKLRIRSRCESSEPHSPRIAASRRK